MEVFVRAEFRQATFGERFFGVFFHLFHGLFTGFFAGGVFGFFGFFAVQQVFAQVGFAGAQGGKNVAFGGLVEHHVGHDALGLDGAAVGRVVACGGDFEGGVRAKLAHGLNRAFAKGLAAHEGGAFVVLQGTGHDFAGRGRAFVDQHHQGHFFQGTASGQCHAGDGVVAVVATPKLG